MGQYEKSDYVSVDADMGLVNHVVGDVIGAQWGVVSIVQGSVKGYQDIFVNVEDRRSELKK